jgi:hypothetical protein
MIEAMKMALEALEEINQLSVGEHAICLPAEIDAAMDALRQAIEQAEHVHAVNTSQERVDETAERKHMTDLATVGEVGVWGEREWVGLTADEIWKCNKAKSGSAVEFHICYAHQNVLDFAEAIEAKLKEKNG